MRLGRRGSVLVHVLMTGVIVAIIAAGLMRMTMLRYVASARTVAGTTARRQADAALHRAITYWNSTGVVCQSFSGYTCGGTPGTCSCSCTPSDATQATIVVSAGPGGACDVDITTVDPLP